MLTTIQQYKKLLNWPLCLKWCTTVNVVHKVNIDTPSPSSPRSSFSSADESWWKFFFTLTSPRGFPAAVRSTVLGTVSWWRCPAARATVSAVWRVRRPPAARDTVETHLLLRGSRLHSLRRRNLGGLHLMVRMILPPAQINNMKSLILQ